MKNIFVFGTVILLLIACNSTQKVVTTAPSTVTFVNSPKLMPVLEMANSKEQLVFVDFYTTWCLPCKMMDEDVFTNKGIYEYFNNNFVSYKVNGEKDNGPNLAVLYQVTAYPTLLFLDGDGNVLVRKEGAAYPTELQSLAEEAIALHNKNMSN